MEVLPPNIALAISRGKFPKGYPGVDPNEDGVMAATDDSTAMLAVADGHSGIEASRAAIAVLESSAVSLLPSAGYDPERALTEAFGLARDSIAEALKGHAEPRRSSRTALTVCFVTERWVTAGSLGDTAAVHRSGSQGSIVGGSGPFLGPDADLAHMTIETVPVAGGDQVMVLSDGLHAFLGKEWLRRLVDLAEGARSPAAFVQAAVTAAFDGGAGDNVAIGSLTF